MHPFGPMLRAVQAMPLSSLQITGNLCAGVAALVFLVPMQRMVGSLGRDHFNDNRWIRPVLPVAVGLWGLAAGVLLCVTAGGGFDDLGFGRALLYVLTVTATLAVGVVWFVFVALFARPGFTPRALYVPAIQLVPLATLLMAVSLLNPGLVPGVSFSWLRWPWLILAGVTLLVCVIFFGNRIVSAGGRVVGDIVRGIGNRGPSTADQLARIAALEPEAHFIDLLDWANRFNRDVREAATARLRSHPDFLTRLCTELESGLAEYSLSFLRQAQLSEAELRRLAGPTRTALLRWVYGIPAPNYTTKKHLAANRRWGLAMFRDLTAKFAGTRVDFAPVLAEFKAKIEPGS